MVILLAVLYIYIHQRAGAGRHTTRTSGTIKRAILNSNTLILCTGMITVHDVGIDAGGIRGERVKFFSTLKNLNAAP